MSETSGTIAVLAANRAFGAIVTMVLSDQPGWQVHLFDAPRQLAQHARIAPLDVVVCDHDFGDDREGGVLPVLAGLHARSGSRPRTIVTTKSLAGWRRADCLRAGIDEVLIKPLSPVHLAERVAAHLAAGARAADFRAAAFGRPLPELPAEYTTGNVIAFRARTKSGAQRPSA